MARHVSTIPMRWSDVDAYQHVNNVTFLDYLQEARVDMLFVHAARHGAERLAAGVVIAEHSVEYRTPLHPRPEPVRIETWVRRLGHASFTLGYEVADVADGGARTTYLVAESILVPYDLAASRPRRLTDAERRALEPHLEPDGPRPRGPAVTFPAGSTPIVHVHRSRVRWGDLDAYNHVNNVTLLEYFQDARVDIAHEHLQDREPHEGAVVAHQAVRYLAPLPFRTEPVDVAVSLLRTGAASYTVGYHIRADGITFAVGHSTQVTFDLSTGMPRRLSAAERDALARLAGE